MGTSFERRAFRAVGPGTMVRALILAASVVAFTASCTTIRQSGFQGTITGGRVESTYLDLGSSDAFVHLSGTLVLEAGGCELTLKDPEGAVAFSRRFVRDEASAAPVRVAIDETKAPKTGVWLLELAGVDESAVGSYDLSLSNR